MTETWEEIRSHPPGAPRLGGAPGKADPAANDSRSSKAALVDVGHTCRPPRASRDVQGAAAPSQPRPPPKLSKIGKRCSADDGVRARRLRTSQESLSDPAETGSSSDSLREDLRAPGPRAFVLGDAAAFRSRPASNGAGPLAGLPPGSPVFRGRGHSLSEYEEKQNQLPEPRVRPSKLRLSPLQPAGPLPALERSLAALRTPSKVDRDRPEGPRLHRNLSDSRLLDNMVSDSSSVNSMRSTFSVLNPIRPQDVRNR